MRVLFGKLRTDLPDLLNGELEEADNCIPYANSYGPFASAAKYSDSASATVVGAYSTRDLSNNVYTLLGTASTLYKESSTSLADISRTATYSVATDDKWEFATFGNTVLAVNGTDAMQVYTMGTSTKFLDQSASASAPVAAHIAVVRDFVMTGNQPDLENRVQWCRINNPLRWTPSQRYQSDYQDLPGTMQNIRHIAGGDFGAIFTQQSVWRATYVGAPLIFRFDEVAPNIGCLAGGSVARYQNICFFLSDSGFYSFDGTNCLPIGVEQIDQTILNELDRENLSKINAAIDPVNKLYMMAYPSTSSGGICDRIAVYSYVFDKWTTVSENTEALFLHMTAGFTLEDLDAFGTMETLPLPLDSSAWQNGIPSIACVSDKHCIARFEGDPKTARFITGEAQVVEDNRAFIKEIRPLVQGNSATTINCRVGGRDRLIDDVVYTGPSPNNYIGICPVRSNSRYQRILMRVSGGFERVMGVDIRSSKEGRR